VNGRKIVAHGGGQQGVSTMLTLDPRSGKAVALMCNLEGAALRTLAQVILNLLPDGPLQ
jgi:hypothetical protein